MTRTTRPLLPGTARRGAAVLALGAALLVTSGCSVLGDLAGPEEAQRDEPNGQVTEASEADVFSIRVGDCIDTAKVADDAEEFQSLPIVPCGDAHDAEVYAETTLPAGDWPGSDSVEKSAEDFCYAAYPDFVGLDYESSTLDFWPLTPLEEGWDQIDDRLVQCVLQSPDSVTGTLEDAAI